MNTKRRNQILVAIMIVEVIAVILLITRVLQVCCVSSSNAAIPTIEAANDSNIQLIETQTAAYEIALAVTKTSTLISDTPEISPTASVNPTLTVSSAIVQPSLTPTASLTRLLPSTTATVSPGVLSASPTSTKLSSTLPAVQQAPATALALQPTTLLAVVPIPTAIPTITSAPTKILPSIQPSTATPTPTTAPTHTATPTAAAPTITATVILESGQCSWGWAINPLPDVTVAAQAALNNAGMNGVTVSAEAYGENCYDSVSGRLLHFGAMTTDFYLNASVSDLNDASTMGQIVITAHNTLSNLNIALPAHPGYLDITFTAGNDKKKFRAQFSDVKAAIDAGKIGAALLAIGGIT